MSAGPRIEQHPDQIVSLEGWQLDQEFPIGPQGAKPKRIVICPNPPPHPFLIGGHRYLFKEPAGSHVQQIWSEVIAYELSRDLRLQVPPAFIAAGPGNGSPGVLVEFFYGYSSEPEVFFVHAIERLQALRFSIDYHRGSLRDNIDLCRRHATHWRTWWGRTLAFDALIGNTDRHTENWGFLVKPFSAGAIYTLAPAFDNGTSLGFIVREEELAKFTKPARLANFIEKGAHHFGWVAGDYQGAGHARLCRQYLDRFPGTRSSMRDAVRLPDTRINRIVEWCCRFSFAVPFSELRARFVAAQLRGRRDALLAELEA